MNGIIHTCSHKNSDDVHFRITEEEIFMAIFNYIEHIFTKIKPQKVFFLAVDGVAPRAKMNQQRARRFRTAKEAADARKRALGKGEELPKEPPFDSNCITPGTGFMARLQEQLKYFINKKISEDASWKEVQVILSGHDVPGEGEHKIMEYIRHAKAQPEYSPNIRHCLYGLDADLMMLGLLSHEPHFSLLREEVLFGRQRKTQSIATPDSQNFHLLHLSLFREYLEMDFSSVKENLPFKFDIENIIDDFILMSFFVGNDFLPHLPGLHINEGALALMFKIYKNALPAMGGYINDNGKLNLARCQKMINGLADREKEQFEEEIGEVMWMESKHEKQNSQSKNHKSGSITSSQKEIYDTIKRFVLERPEGLRLSFQADLPTKNKAFILKVSKDLGISHTIEVPEDSSLQTLICLDLESDDDESDEESSDARQRVFKRYDKMKIVDEEESGANVVDEKRNALDKHFVEWKASYYKEKLEIDYNNSNEMRGIVYSYIEGLQWVLFYYYRGVASWEWFFPFHYAPRATDLVNIDSFDIKFELGSPFKPFEQLMGVLPAASGVHIPEAFRTLMTDAGSPILDFYPTDFELDMNGKKQDWEAVVKVPFIDEKRLLAALKSREHLLTDEERRRNSSGKQMLFKFSLVSPFEYPSALPGIFPTITQCRCLMTPFELPQVRNGFWFGLCKGAKLGSNMLAGFPSMKTLPHTATLGFHGVTPFKVESRNQSVVVTLSNTVDVSSPESIAKEKIGKSVFVGWPYLWEALVSSISDELFNYTLQNGQVVKTPHNERAEQKFFKVSESLEHYYSKRYGVLIGQIDVILHCRLIKGMLIEEDSSLRKDFSTEDTDFPLQVALMDPKFEDIRYKEMPPPRIEDEFPINSKVFFLGTLTYGHYAEIAGYRSNLLDIRIYKSGNPEFGQEPSFAEEISRKASRRNTYMPGFQLARSLGLLSITVSRITSSMHVISRKDDSRLNIGLNLKFESKGQKSLGYTRKGERGWEYSDLAVQLIKDYYNKFPQIFQYIDKHPKSDLYEDVEIFPPQIAEAKMGEVRQWIKSVGLRNIETVPLDTEALSKDEIKEIEQKIDDLMGRLGSTKLSSVIVKDVPRASVLKPAHSRHRLTNQEFRLGDRVIYTFDQGSVPLATKGTVVGLDGPVLQVVFDKAFMGGLDLGGRCSPYRGAFLYKDTLLNLSRPQPPVRGRAQPAWGVRKEKAKGGIDFNQRGAPMKNEWGSKSKSLENIAAKREIRQTLGVQSNIVRTTVNSQKPDRPTTAPQKVLSYSISTSSKAQTVEKSGPDAPVYAASVAQDTTQIAASLKSMLNIQTPIGGGSVPPPSYANPMPMPYGTMPYRPPHLPGTVPTHAYNSQQMAGHSQMPNHFSQPPRGNGMGNVDVLAGIMNNLQRPAPQAYYRPPQTKVNGPYQGNSAQMSSEGEDTGTFRHRGGGRGGYRGRGRGNRQGYQSTQRDH